MPDSDCVVCHCETVGYLLSRMTLHLSEITFRTSVLIVLSSFITVMFFTTYVISVIFFYYGNGGLLGKSPGKERKDSS